MRILVTGSSGFVGHALMGVLMKQGAEVRGISRQAGKPWSMQGDLLDRDQTVRLFRAFQPEVVYHLAARTALKGAAAGFEENVVTTDHVLDAVESTSSVRRAVWLSSQLVNRPGRLPAADTEYDPPDAYGESKAEAERHIRLRDGGRREWVIGRSTTIWGPGMSEHYAGVIRMIARGLYFHVGRRPLYKSYSYIDNLSSQLQALAFAPADRVHGRTFYLADSEPISLRNWTDAFAEEYGRTIPTIPVPIARTLGVAGDILSSLGRRSPITSDRVRNVLTEYVYPTDAINAVHGPTEIGWREGVRQTADWLKTRSGAQSPG